MKFNFLTILFFCTMIFFAGIGGLPAENARTNGFKYYKEISGYNKNNPPSSETAFGRILIDEEISRYSGSYDKRIAFNGKLVPFFTRDALKNSGRTGKKIPKIVFNSIKKEKRIYVLKLPELAEDVEYSELAVTNKGSYEAEGSYEATVSVSFSNNPDEWEFSEIKSISSYGGQSGSAGKIQFNSGKYSYVRLEFDSKDEFFFPHATYSPVKEQMEYKTKINLTELKKSQDNDKSATVYYFENNLAKPIHRLVFQFKEEKYKRNIEIDYKDDRKNYVNLVQSVIKRKKTDKPELSVSFSQTVHSALKITIVDGDDNPLTLTAIEGYSPIEEIIFQLPSNESNNDKDPEFRIYYGNKYSYPPEFDFQKTYEENRKFVTFTTEKHTINEKFSYSVMEPPLSSWIIRIIFLLGTGGIAYPAFKVFKKYSEELKKAQT